MTTSKINEHDLDESLVLSIENHNHEEQNINPMSIGLGSGQSSHGGYIDFHFGGTTDNYTSRIIENTNGSINIEAPNGVKVNNNSVVTSNIALNFNITDDGILQINY